MKTVLKNQKTVSAIVALALAAVVTFVAGVNSYGVTSNEAEIVFDFDETALMERAIADLEDEVFDFEEEVSLRTIKIYNENNELLETVTVGQDEVVENELTQQRLNQAEFLSEYNNTLIYKISE
ncbi:MAG: hypothetical protein HEP71_25060 [Roseivirga sp.]|nr:hypothetical protein [Roseivirga sp.]